jgi:hypothetical protein
MNFIQNTVTTAWETDEEIALLHSDFSAKAFLPTVTDAQLAEQQREAQTLVNPPTRRQTRVTPKDYLTAEEARNKDSADLFQALVQRAFGTSDDVSVGHHISFQPHGKVKELNEIPSADTAIFDHVLMGEVFGDQAIPLMQALAALPCERRDAKLREVFEALPAV